MIKKLLWILYVGIGLIFAVIIVCNEVVVSNSKGKIYNDVEGIPHNRYGLLLGTSPITPWGTHNYYFDNRVNTAAELYNAGKIDFIIASGGDYRATEKYGCDEPAAMRDSLIAHGIPAEKIILDYDGTRTLKSIIKVKEDYCLDSLTIISQEYHNQRALYMAKHFDINAEAFNAKEPNSKKHKLKNHLREYFARVKMFIDILFYSSDISFKSKGLDRFRVPEIIVNLKNTNRYYSISKEENGYYKCFNSKNDTTFYYNNRHGYYVLLPRGMGENQRGEHLLGAHSNEFYNHDTTLVVSCNALFYDVLLDDSPEYQDSLHLYEIEYLKEKGSVDFLINTPDTIITKVKIDRSNPENPQADFLLSKWVIKKDIDNRECHMELYIWYNDSLKNREPEFLRIIEIFPDNPLRQ